MLGQVVSIVEESAVIVWDPATHTEHFIRRAAFNTTALDFGFLVPTPSKPSLASASDWVFANIQGLLKPKTVVSETHGVDLTPLFVHILSMFNMRARDGNALTATAPPVRVLDVQRVAGYDAVVLEADNPAALGSWLEKHGYASGPDLNAWLEPYVAAHWKITAFKIARASGRDQVGTSAVRMSFTTDRPFFPYREPASQRAQSPDASQRRSLQVLFLGDARVDGRIGSGNDNAWPARTIWSDQLGQDDAASLARDLSLADGQIPSSPWLTVFEDDSSPRPGFDDLYFTRSEAQYPTLIEQVVTVDKRIPVPIDVVLILACVLVGLMLLVRFALKLRRVRNSIDNESFGELE